MSYVHKKEDAWKDLSIGGLTSSEKALHGDAALAAARQLLPLINQGGASSALVTGAVGLLDEWGDAEHTFDAAASRVHEWGKQQYFGDTGSLAHLPRPVRLALEMSAHEDQERRAMEGELAQLEEAWKEAEEVAAIADNLLVPNTVSERFTRLRARFGTKR